jgi:uncharacterized protein (DUF427 family)
MGRFSPIIPQPGQESVWDYPRPPRLEASTKLIQVVLGGITIAESRHTLRVLETSHPPVYYIPSVDIQMDHLRLTPRVTFCEFKGEAHYYTVNVGDIILEDAAWYYPAPTASYAEMRDYVAFYPGKMEACYVDGERVQAQPGDFYGGWITHDIVGPFKGGPGTMGW